MIKKIRKFIKHFIAKKKWEARCPIHTGVPDMLCTYCRYFKSGTCQLAIEVGLEDEDV